MTRFLVALAVVLAFAFPGYADNPPFVSLQTAADTPTGTIAPGQSGVTLAKFVIRSGSQPVEVSFNGYDLELVAQTGPMETQLSPVSLTDDTGQKLTPKYRIPPQTTRVISMKVDVAPTAGFSSVTAWIKLNDRRLRGQPLTLANSLLFSSRNPSMGTTEISIGGTSQLVGWYVLRMYGAEDALVHELAFTAGDHASEFSNLCVEINGKQFGPTQQDLANGVGYKFSGAPFLIPKGGAVAVKLYADVQNNATAGVKGAITMLWDCTAITVSSHSALSCLPVLGQNVVVVGTPTPQPKPSSSPPPSGTLIVYNPDNPD